MKVKELIRMLRGLEDFDLKDCGITTEILDALDAQPVVRGKWIKMSDADGIFYGCSECGEWHKETNNFCSNCGADMMGVDENNA